MTKAKMENITRMATVLMDSNDAIIMQDFNGKILAWNRGAKDIYGYTEAEALEMNINNIVAESDREVALTLIEKIKHGEIVKSFELKRKTKDGRIIDVWLTITLLNDEKGEPSLIATTERDITERKLALKEKEKQAAELIIANKELHFQNEEKEKRAAELIKAKENAEEQKTKFEILSNVTFEGILVYDKGVPNDMNNSFAIMFGYTKDELLNKELVKLLIKKEYQKLTYNNIKKDYVFPYEVIGIKKDGTEFPIELEGNTFISKYNQKLRATAIRDITKRKQAEDEIKKHHEHLEELVKERTKNLKEKNNELEAFSYSVSHDLRAPLRSIDGFSKIILEDYFHSLDKLGKHYLQRIRAGSQKMGILIDDILKLSIIGRKSIKKEDVNLIDVTIEAYKILENEWKNRKINFVVGDCRIINCDANLIQLVFVNLFSNAIKFTKNETVAEIGFGCIQKDKITTFFVKDNGVGFDMKYADKLFSPFQRLHSTEEFEGTGIGLAIIKRIINRHDGKIWIESEINKGTSVYFTL